MDGGGGDGRVLHAGTVPTDRLPTMAILRCFTFADILGFLDAPGGWYVDSLKPGPDGTSREEEGFSLFFGGASVVGCVQGLAVSLGR